MKKLRNISLLALILIGITNVQAQSFEGKIKFSIEYIEVPDMFEAVEGMLPTETLYYVKGNMIRTEVPQLMGSYQVVIFNTEKNEGAMLMDMAGAKQAVTMSSEYLKAQEEKLGQSTPEIKYLNEYKTIAGYKCQKAIVTQNEQATIVYFTDKIPNVGQNFKGLKGMALQYSVEKNGLKSTETASTVLFQTVPDSTFEIPDDYEQISIEEFTGNNGSK